MTTANSDKKTRRRLSRKTLTMLRRVASTRASMWALGGREKARHAPSRAVTLSGVRCLQRDDDKR